MEINYVSTKQRILLFIDIFENLLSETIQFNRSKARPLFLNASFFRSNLLNN